jgi:hypothetical protein
VLIRGVNDAVPEPDPEEVELLPAIAEPGQKLSNVPAKALTRKPKTMIPPWRKLALMRELADPQRTQLDMAREYGVVPSVITDFKQKNAGAIAKIKANVDDKYAGLWVADKLNRIATYEADIEAIEAKAQRDGATMAEADMLRVKGSFLRAVAEELGQLPAKVNVTVTPVEHIIIGVNPEELT